MHFMAEVLRPVVQQWEERGEAIEPEAGEEERSIMREMAEALRQEGPDQGLAKYRLEAAGALGSANHEILRRIADGLKARRIHLHELQAVANSYEQKEISADKAVAELQKLLRIAEAAVTATKGRGGQTRKSEQKPI